MFKVTSFVAGVLQAAGGVIGIGALAVAVLLPISTGEIVRGIGIGAAGVIGGLVLFAFGGLVRVQVMAYRNSERTANALNRIARAQTGVAEFIPARNGVRSVSADV